MPAYKVRFRVKKAFGVGNSLLEHAESAILILLKGPLKNAVTISTLISITTQAGAEWIWSQWLIYLSQYTIEHMSPYWKSATRSGHSTPFLWLGARGAIPQLSFEVESLNAEHIIQQLIYWTLPCPAIKKYASNIEHITHTIEVHFFKYAYASVNLFARERVFLAMWTMTVLRVSRSNNPSTIAYKALSHDGLRSSTCSHHIKYTI